MTDPAPDQRALVPEDVPGLDLPLGRRLDLPGRGTTFIREIAGPSPGAPTVLLIHGWMASGGLNWFQAFTPLSKHFRVVAPDLRGHGRGIKNWRRFRLSDCADDCAAIIDELGTGPVIVVGYSLGGPVAQLLWRRHPDKVAGLVLSATSDSFIPGIQQRVVFVGMMAAAAGTTRTGQFLMTVPAAFGRQIPLRGSGRPDTFRRWAPQEFQRHDLRMVFEAGNAIATFSSRRWIRHVDVPTAVLVTTRDRAVLPVSQLRLALHIPHATIHRLDEGHTAPMLESFGPAVTDACLEVSREVEGVRGTVSRLRSVH
ncbi:MAG TPA: alpha/beta hydrolase, partial [Microthrixaceae bacterium]|nr:alpha/beta hydrolase [Microthrixaceae bacterium]